MSDREETKYLSQTNNLASCQKEAQRTPCLSELRQLIEKFREGKRTCAESSSTGRRFTTRAMELPKIEGSGAKMHQTDPGHVQELEGKS